MICLGRSAIIQGGPKKGIPWQSATAKSTIPKAAITVTRTMPPSRETRTKEIALAINTGVPHLQRIAQGIRDYADRHRTDWRFMVSAEMFNLTPTALKGWSGGGVIAHCETPDDERALLRLGCPVVNVSGVLPQSSLPRICNDNREVGRLAALNLLRRGFRRFGYYGISGAWYSSGREAGFGEEIEAAGASLEVLRSVGSFARLPRWDHHQDDLDRWLASIQPPFAVMGVHDPRAAMVIRACRRIGLRVPADVAVIGCANDPVICEWQRPTLSSIDLDAWTLGFRSAEMLDRMMKRRQVPAETVVSPRGVMERDSTDTHSFEQPQIAAAIRFIETEFQRPVSVDEIAEASGKSRRWIEQMFRRELGASPSEFLKQTRVRAVANHLKQDPAARPGQLASTCGFNSNRQMYTAFLKKMAMSVDDYRGLIARRGTESSQR